MLSHALGQLLSLRQFEFVGPAAMGCAGSGFYAGHDYSLDGVWADVWVGGLAIWPHYRRSMRHQLALSVQQPACVSGGAGLEQKQKLLFGCKFLKEYEQVAPCARVLVAVPNACVCLGDAIVNLMEY